MNTTTLESATTSIAPTGLPKLKALDRLALAGGLILIRWAQRRGNNPDRPAMEYRRRTDALENAASRRELVQASLPLSRH